MRMPPRPHLRRPRSVIFEFSKALILQADRGDNHLLLFCPSADLVGGRGREGEGEERGGGERRGKGGLDGRGGERGRG